VLKTRSVVLLFAILWLIGIALRLTILAVPPVIPALRSELSLSGTEIGILTGLPIVLFAVAALPGSLLIARTGALATAITGLLLVGIASGLRGVAGDVAMLFLATIGMGAGVAISQPAVAALIRRWLPHRVGLATAIYTNGLLVGEILPVALFPLVIAAVDQSWRATFFIWAAPVLAIALIVMLLSPRDPVPVTVSGRARWWPDWRDPEIWRVGFVFGSANTMYFASNAFLPGQLAEVGRSDLISPALTALNLGQLPASFLLIGLAGYLERRTWPFVACGVIALIGMAGVVTTAGVLTVVSAGLIGFAAGGAFALGLALPPLLSAPEDTARMSAAMFTVSYTGAVVISVLAGACWDLTGSAAFAFVPIAIAALPSLLLAPTIRFQRQTV